MKRHRTGAEIVVVIDRRDDAVTFVRVVPEDRLCFPILDTHAPTGLYVRTLLTIQVPGEVD
jgi:hypothetical protein